MPNTTTVPSDRLTHLAKQVTEAFRTARRSGYAEADCRYYQGMRDAYRLMGGRMADLPDADTYMDEAAR